MAGLGWILRAPLALVIVTGAILAATPLHLRLAARGGGSGARVILEARTFWGMTPALRLVDTDRPGKPKRRKPARPARRRKPRVRERALPVSRARVMRIARGLPGLIAGEAARIHLDRPDLDARVGTGEPADTGRLFGCAAPLLYGLPRKTVALRLTPDFERAVFEGRAELALHLTPSSRSGR